MLSRSSGPFPNAILTEALRLLNRRRGRGKNSFAARREVHREKEDRRLLRGLLRRGGMLPARGKREEGKSPVSSYVVFSA